MFHFSGSAQLLSEFSFQKPQCENFSVTAPVIMNTTPIYLAKALGACRGYAIYQRVTNIIHYYIMPNIKAAEHTS